ncbi:GATOR complex protein WDR24 [Lucilia cuprina]|uniref:GATOR complex protein WDR24 n=1 Tax=Lucilia cuprina TaxID=7375 RepID=UPI001F05D5B6|nr:GATOR complex protein WDR24 [Lucilia cuprina]XP_046804592.1 GATOR complex protein WDR24 [Lucilia cuprina]
MLEESGTVSLRICQEGHANALVLNKDCNKIAVAGRSLLKVFAINNDGFTEVCNMRGGKNQNLSYSSNDVAWSTLDTNILATAATNGVVSVWDLSKFGKQKQWLVYNDHERTAHAVTFHNTEVNTLISGSQDGTIKCFDTRSDKACNTFYSNSESVRDVKFSPHSNNLFSAVLENGTVQLWDLRRTDKCLLQFPAHMEPIYTCDWHPTQNWLATGSRDKQIKIWNMEGKASLEHTIHTIAVVGRVKWRPEKTYHIASCSLVVDYSIHIWDIRRPFVPFASFNDHTDVTTGIAWKGNDPYCLLSTSKDSTIYKHAFKDASRPALKANVQGASLGRKGDISFANKLKFYLPVTAAQVVKSNAMLTRQKSITGLEQFHIGKSDMCRFLLNTSLIGYMDPENSSIELKEHECFIGCAKELILTGKKLADICKHNANVCRKHGKHNATTLWNFIEICYASNEMNKQKYEHRNSFSNQKNAQIARRTAQVVSTDNSKWDHNKNNNVNGSDDNIDIKSQDDENLIDSGGSSGKQTYPPYGSVILSESQILSEITFDNFDSLRNGFIYVGPPDFTKALSLPETALHCDVQAARPQLDIKAKNREKSPPPNLPVVLKISSIPPIPLWEPHQFLADALMLQNDVGDVQTALTILIVMGENRKFLPIEEDLIEHWFQTYIDQLHRYQMWNEACTIMNLSWLRPIRELNQKSTGVHTNCGDCGRPLGGSVGWYCQKCKSMRLAKCSICSLIVRGLYAWCQGCSHGGHIQHVMDYFANHSKCPKCGHLCEYN